MKREDWKEFNLLMAELALAFRTDISQESIKVYGKHLADYSIEAVTSAVSKAIQTGERFPVIKTLRELANAYRPPQKSQPMTEAVQIAEFSEAQVVEAKQNLDDLINGLESSMSCV
jgi:hypothetical protein